MTDSAFAGSPFLRESAALDHRVEDTRGGLRARHDEAAAEVRTAGRAGDGITLLAATRRLESVLATARRELGPSDADTLVVEGTLAVAYLLGDDEPRGLELAGRNLGSRTRTFGPDHPATLVAADAVAAALRVIGYPEHAVARHEDVITRRSRVLGESHPCTVASRAALALARADGGDLRGAAWLLSSTLGTAEQFLGVVHPVTVAVREIMAEFVETQRLEAAEASELDTKKTTLIPRLPGQWVAARPAFFDRPSGPQPFV
ncbi:hypothetical protein FRP1_00190 [Pseudonocardia sp. EC080625-04]|uniref:tetratricopeptide repeat protein n=1 Tax=unclassified Pseudonocardia TaxID=2619320 RepID=UPI0006CB058D|nr:MULTISPECIES: tetratricopeptide repeat protein [unclassified Pseudonocardia]ALE71957.1 hypothetical protein FRP1_00190 [Pseudonocardia sp. EC080625-04]ALL85820.1 hypothetical protein AD017_32180 [Pseudonocardia sp. EC080619-01]